MSGDDSSNVKSLIQQAIMLSDEEREAFLDEVCKDDISLRKRINDILGSIDAPLTVVNNASQAWGLPAEGSTIGKYTILEKLGGGGMGVVFRAEDSRLKRHVALKFLAPELTRDAGARERFVHEAQAASALDHLNICTIYEVDETPQGLTYIAMACYEGKTLKTRIEEGPIPVETAMDYAVQIGKGLARAHAKGIIHRDIKPANIMVVDNGDHETIKILDFGLAKIAEISITRTGSTLGTVAYMSPEQARGNTVDHRTDIWSLGVVLYEMLTGHRPFSGAFEQAMIYALLHEDIKPPTTYRPDLPEYLVQVLEKTLAREPDERYQTVESLLEDLANSEKSVITPQISLQKKVPARASSSILRPNGLVYMALVAVVVLAALTVGILTGKNEGVNDVQPDRTAEREKLTITGKAYIPAISPDGQLMAYYSRDTDTTGTIRVQELSGGQPLTVLSNITSDYVSGQIKWSPDGKTIAYPASIGSDEAFKMHLVSRLGGQARTFDATWIHAYSWSPDGNTIVWSRETFSNGLNFINLQTLNTTNHPFSLVEEQIVSSLDWSPDGERITILVEDLANRRFSIWVTNLDGSVKEKVVEDDDELFSTRWSRDGNSIYYLKKAEQEFDLWKVSTTRQFGSKNEPRLVSSGLPNANIFSISGDGQNLVMHGGEQISNLWLFQASDRSEQRPPLKITNFTTWIDTPEVSPDDSLVAFIMRDGQGDNVYTLSLSGGELLRHTYLTTRGSGVTWSPKGDKIAFGTSQDDASEIGLVDLETGVTRFIGNSERSRGINGDLLWGPGENILYKLPEIRNYALKDVNIGAEKLLVDNDSVGWILQAAYSEARNEVAVHWNRRLGVSRKYPGYQIARGIWLISLDDGQQTYLSDTSDLYPFKYAKDGSSIYALQFLANYSILQRVSSDGDRIEPVVSIPEVVALDITSDGSQVVAVIQEYRSDVWRIANFDSEVTNHGE